MCATRGGDTTISHLEQHLSLRRSRPVGRASIPGAVIGPGQVTAPVISPCVGILVVTGILVGFLRVPVGHSVAARIDDVVQVPSPGLVAERVKESTRLPAGLGAVIARHRHRPGRVGPGRVPRKAVQTEVVLGAVGGGHPPVLAGVLGATLIAVLGTGQFLDSRSVLITAVPALRLIENELTALTIEVEDGIVRAPAQVTGT